MQLKLAQVGYGYWGKNLFRVFSSQKNTDLALCCDKDPKALANFREAYPSVPSCAAYADVLGRADIQAVILATPAGLHYEQSRAALLAGKHVFVEKPLALSTREARELMDLAAQKKLTLMVGHTFLYNDAVRWVKSSIEKGEFGDIYYAYCQRLNLGIVRSDVNALWNLAPHDISVVQYWFGELPCRVQAHGQAYLQKGVHDVNFVNMWFSSGRFAHVHVSWLDPFKTRRAVIVGSRKMVVYDDSAPDQRITVFDKGIDRKAVKEHMGKPTFEDLAEFYLMQRAGDITIPKLSFREPLQVESQHFVECVLEGKRPISDGQNGLEVVQTLEAAQNSMQGQGI